MRDIIVLNGKHQAGKTTLGTMLLEKSDKFKFFPEIGGQLRNEVQYNSLSSSEPFDREVMRRELERSQEILQCQKIPVVETWHPGNIAYAEQRSPLMVPEYLRKAEEELGIFKPIPVIVDVTEPTFRSRITEHIRPDEVDILAQFYQGIFQSTVGFYIRHKIQPLFVNGELPVQQSLQNLIGMLELNGINI